MSGLYVDFAFTMKHKCAKHYVRFDDKAGFMDHLMSYVLVASAGLVAGTMNAVAGGGSFVTFPALVLVGVPSVGANMSSTFALFPASLASAYAYRKEFTDLGGVSIKILLPISLVGGFLGALLLLLTPSSTFDALVPWLLLVASLVFAFGQRASKALQRFVHLGVRSMIVGQFMLGIYAGYFGGAVGLMMMATWSLFNITDLHAMNAAKSLIVGSTNTLAVGLFIYAGGIDWLFALIMLCGALVGGYLGAYYARRLPQKELRLAINCLNLLITILFFWRAFG
jgi:uncharacterized protein